MNWDALGALGELIGSIAVLVTLIYLAIQTKQSKEAVMRASRLNLMDQRVRNSWAEGDSQYIAPLIAKAENGEPLNQEDLIRARSLLWAEFVRCRFMFSEELFTTKNPGTIFAALIRYLELFGTFANQEWVDYTKKTGTSSEFQKWVEENVHFESGDHA